MGIIVSKIISTIKLKKEYYLNKSKNRFCQYKTAKLTMGGGCDE